MCLMCLHCRKKCSQSAGTPLTVGKTRISWRSQRLLVDRQGESSATVKVFVEVARERQRARFDDEGEQVLYVLRENALADADGHEPVTIGGQILSSRSKGVFQWAQRDSNPWPSLCK